MRKLLALFSTVFALSGILALPALAHAEIVEVTINGDERRTESGCYWDTSRKGVLIDYRISNPPADKEKTADTPFNCYIRVFLNGNSALIITIATIIVVGSGIQYMLALGNSGNQGKAKQRIISVISGVIFLTLIRFFLRILGT